MSIPSRIIILPLSIILNYCLTKKSDLTFIGCHNVQLQSCSMVMATYVRAPLWYDDVRACVLTRFVPYSLHKFRLTLSVSYFWLWHLSILSSCHVLSADYIRVRLVHLFSFFFRLHAVEIFLYHFRLYPRCILSCLLMGSSSRRPLFLHANIIWVNYKVASQLSQTIFLSF